MIIEEYISFIYFFCSCNILFKYKLKIEGRRDALCIFCINNLLFKFEKMMFYRFKSFDTEKRVFFFYFAHC